MVSSMVYDIHLSLAVACLPHGLYALHSADRVHPVMIAIDEGDGDLQLTDSVDQRHPGVCARFKEMRNTVLPRAFCHCDVENIIVQVPCLFLVQTLKPSARVLPYEHGPPEECGADDLERRPALLPEIREYLATE